MPLYFHLFSCSLILFVLSFQVIGFVYGLIIEQFGWTVYIVLVGFAVSCVVSCFDLLRALFVGKGRYVVHPR